MIYAHFGEGKAPECNLSKHDALSYLEKQIKYLGKKKDASTSLETIHYLKGLIDGINISIEILKKV